MASTEQDVHDSDSDLDTSTSTQSASTRTTARKKQVRHRFSSWTFQLTFSTDSAALNGGPASVPLQERQKYLLEHIRSRIINTDKMPRIVTFVEAYYNASIISGALADGISISIPLLGFVQTRACTNCEISTMQFWFPASWAPVPGGLSSNQEFKDNARRSEDPTNTWTKLCVFGSLGLNNTARGEKRQLMKVCQQSCGFVSIS
jgi:hypothetical protein